MTTWTAQNKASAASYTARTRSDSDVDEAYLEIGGGYFLEIGGGFKLIIQPQAIGTTWNARSKS